MEMFAVHKRLVKLPGNPKWLPNSMTYIVPNTFTHGGLQTIQVQTCCGQVYVSYGLC